MAYYLKFDGVNDHVTYAEINRSDTTFALEVDIATQEARGQLNRFLGNSASFASYIDLLYTASLTLLDYRIGGTTKRFTWAIEVVDISDLLEHKVEVIFDGTTLRAYIDTIEADNSFVGSASFVGFNTLGRANSQYATFDLYRFRYYADDAKTSIIYDYNPSSSGGTGLILPNDVGGNDGTLVNFPVDNSQWVFYPEAGGGVTGSSAFNLPKLTLSATGSATLPQPNANGAFNLNLLTVSSSGTATLPQPEISGAFSLQPVTVSSTGSATSPQPTIAGAFSFNALTVSSTGTATLPQPNINGSFSYPLLTVDASGSATTANPFINGNITFNKLTVASTGSATLPQPDITGAFSLPKLTVEGTASALVPQPIINGNIALSKLTISATGEVTLPQPIANGAFNIPFITVSGFATISGLQLIIDRETNINQQFLSANINQKNLSNNFIYH